MGNSRTHPVKNSGGLTVTYKCTNFFLNLSLPVQDAKKKEIIQHILKDQIVFKLGSGQEKSSG